MRSHFEGCHGIFQADDRKHAAVLYFFFCFFFGFGEQEWRRDRDGKNLESRVIAGQVGEKTVGSGIRNNNQFDRCDNWWRLEIETII